MPVFDESDGVQSTITGCPCGTHHARTQYGPIGRVIVVQGSQHEVLRCPTGRAVYLRYDDLVIEGEGDATTIYAPIVVNDVPAVGSGGRTR